MTFVIMVITACLGTVSCRDYRWQLAPEVTLLACERQGPLGLAQWAGDHPGLLIRRWRCEAVLADKSA